MVRGAYRRCRCRMTAIRGRERVGGGGSGGQLRLLLVGL
jgi:hypothetical protein